MSLQNQYFSISENLGLKCIPQTFKIIINSFYKKTNSLKYGKINNIQYLILITNKMVKSEYH